MKIIKRKSAVKPITGSIVDSTNIADKTTNTYSAEIIDGLTGIVTVTNDNGTAIKYPDGTMICHGSIAETVKITNGYGSSFYCNIDIVFAETFISNPTVTVTVTAPSNIIIPALYVVKPFSAGGFLQCAKSVASEAITKNYTAIGRWK